MTNTPLIRREVTADRGPLFVTTDEVLGAAIEIGEKEFTVSELAEQIKQKHRSADHRKVDNAVKSAVSWLVQRDVFTTIGSRMSRSVNCRYPYQVQVYRLTARPIVADFTTLYRALGVGC